MDDDVKVLERIYDRFNARDIDGVLTALTDDVAWANGMDGGYVHGREAIREYWTRQWTMVSPHVEPWAFIELRMARSSQKCDSPSAISKANRSKGSRRTGSRTRRSDMSSVFERARWLASTSRMPPRNNPSLRRRKRSPGRPGNPELHSFSMRRRCAAKR